eukprot:CAMPEP_0173422332 /NCGR_PEP_ID=MMETSP1357-20121228/3087_1 /TAXON_ID=77926 /ORGANISM="Hemiselmis rufescens, Strain PCC563" /LENGTH=67 /DNA_ID=CAMNT_0014385351 /DNA_START=308 /DNA_END=507 /DNA_ORIENTATION=-
MVWEWLNAIPEEAAVNVNGKLAWASEVAVDAPEVLDCGKGRGGVKVVLTLVEDVPILIIGVLKEVET